jgi:hypothetical protein
VRVGELSAEDEVRKVSHPNNLTNQNACTVLTILTIF